MPDILWTGLGNLPVLTVQTPETASGGGNGKGKGAWFEVIQGFFLNGIHMDSTWRAVSEAVKGTVHIYTRTAHTPVSRGQYASVGTDAAHGALVLELLLVSGPDVPFPEFFRRIMSEYVPTDVFGATIL